MRIRSRRPQKDGNRLEARPTLFPAWNLDLGFLEALGQRVVGKRGEGVAEGRFFGEVSGAFPAAEAAARGPAFQRCDEGGSGEN